MKESFDHHFSSLAHLLFHTKESGHESRVFPLLCVSEVLSVLVGRYFGSAEGRN